MSFLLMVFLTLVCLFESYPAPLWGGSPGLAALLTGLLVLAVAGHAYWLSRQVSRPLARDPSLRDRVLAQYERRRSTHQIGQFVVFTLALCLCGWGWAVREAWCDAQHRPWHGLELLTLAPFLVGQALSWVFFYDADRAAHLAAHRLLDGEGFAQNLLPEGGRLKTEGSNRDAVVVPSPVFPLPHSEGGRWTYVAFQMRQKLALVFIPVMLLVAQKELFRLLPGSPQRWQGLVNFVAIGAMLGVFVGMPWLIRLLLGLRPLPAGRLRDRLVAAARRLGFRCSDILLWNTRSGMANAMVIGLVPWVRYVVFTDRLLEEFTEDEVEAVFGHEVGHVRHQHMPYYLAFLTLSMAVIGLLTEHHLAPALAAAGKDLAATFPRVVPAWVGEVLGPNGNRDLMALPVVALLVPYIYVVFGFLSRRCERQADVYGSRAVSCGSACCGGHGEETALAERAGGLCPTGIDTFIRALEKVALLNGISRERPGFFQSWQHSTIARRVAFLQGLASDPRREAVFQTRLAVVKWGLLLGLVAALAALVLAHGWRW
jgi:Zn-dependent protease with chaperone function